MGIYTRLFFAFFAAVALGIFGWGFVSPDMLLPRSEGQILMHWSLVPAALTLLTVAFYTRSHKDTFFYLALIFFGACLAMVCAGMYQLTGGATYAAFAIIGFSIGCAPIVTVTLKATVLRTNTSRA